MSDSGSGSPHPHQQFRTFLSGLRPRGGYCVDCLSRLFEAPPREVQGYLEQIGLLARHTECANCGEEKNTFRDNPYL
jgi:hypothetical protein